MTCLLILIGMGYTLLRSKLGTSDFTLPLCGVVAGVHAVLVTVGRLQDDAHYKYHENEGMVGWLILVIRLALFIWFLHASRATAAVGGNRLKSFMTRFVAAGSMYFVAYPTIFLVFKLFAPYMQHGLMTIALMIMQLASNAWLCSLFLSRGEYFKISTLSGSALPGGAMFKLD